MDDKQPMSDMMEEKIPVDMSPQEFEAQVELHRRGLRSERSQHVDLSKEEYSPDEIAHMLGTTREVVVHAVRAGELKAQRAGHDIVCIKHEDVVEWLRNRGGV